MSKRTVSVVFGIIDAIITVIFFWMVFALKYSQKDAIDNIYYSQLAP